MTANPLPETSPAKPKADDFSAITDSLRSRFPKATAGILFCIYKLEQDPTLTIPDFRDEAKLHGISLGGRALHAAKLLLGLKAAPAKPKATRANKGGKRNAQPRKPKLNSVSLEDQVMNAITQIQESATDQSLRLREAMREAIRVLEAGLED